MHEFWSDLVLHGAKGDTFSLIYPIRKERNCQSMKSEDLDSETMWLWGQLSGKKRTCSTTPGTEGCDKQA